MVLTYAVPAAQGTLCCDVYKEFLQELVVASRRHKDELLTAMLELLLSAPHALLRPIVSLPPHARLPLALLKGSCSRAALCMLQPCPVWLQRKHGLSRSHTTCSRNPSLDDVAGNVCRMWRSPCRPP